jgi:hypothetical protein
MKAQRALRHFRSRLQRRSARDLPRGIRHDLRAQADAIAEALQRLRRESLRTQRASAPR